MLQRAGIMLLLAVLLPGLSAAEGGGEQLPESTSQGVVEYREGSVEIDGERAAIGDLIPEGAWVETGEAARCDIVFGGKNVIRVYADTRVRLGLPQGRAEMLEGAVGAVFQRLKSLVSEREGFTFASPSAVAGVRGTVFYIRAATPGETYFCTCHGRVDLEDPAGGHRHETANANHGAYWYRLTGEGSYVTEQEGLRFHDSAAMDDIAERIGVEIPWGEPPE